MLKCLSLVILLGILASNDAFGQDDAAQPIVRMTATEWPPFVGKELPENGAAIAVIRDTFARAGVRLMPSFAAWQRSLATAVEGEDFIAVGPVYFSEERARTCHLSVSFGKSHVGFVERKDTPIRWHTLEDLTGVAIGTVSGYVNTAAFDQMASEQILDVSAVYNDALNLRRVAFGRIDLAVIDRDVMHYLLAQDKKLRPYRALLQMNARLLATHDQLICFKRTAEGKAMRDLFNAHFDKAYAETLMARKIAEITAQATTQNGRGAP